MARLGRSRRNARQFLGTNAATTPTLRRHVKRGARVRGTRIAVPHVNHEHSPELEGVEAHGGEEPSYQAYTETRRLAAAALSGEMKFAAP